MENICLLKHTGCPSFVVVYTFISLYRSLSSYSLRYQAEHQLILFARAAVSENRQAQQLDEGQVDQFSFFLVSIGYMPRLLQSVLPAVQLFTRV